VILVEADGPPVKALRWLRDSRELSSIESLAAHHFGLSIDADHSPAALRGSTSFFPYLFQAMTQIVASTRADMCGRSPTIASSKDEIHWSLLYFMTCLPHARAFREAIRRARVSRQHIAVEQGEHEMESREVLTLRLMAWERAKGELRAMLATYWPTPSVHHDPETLARDPMVKRVEGFIAAVEREL